MAAGLTGPDEVDPPIIAATVALLTLLSIALTLGCALSASAAPGPQRRNATWFAAGVAALLGLTMLSPPSIGALASFWVLGPLLLSAVVVLTAESHDPDGAPGSLLAACVIIFVGFPILLVVTIFTLWDSFPRDLAEALTRVVGNPPINPADEDSLITLMAIPVGLIFGGFVLSVHRFRRLAAEAERREMVGNAFRHGPASVWPD